VGLILPDSGPHLAEGQSLLAGFEAGVKEFAHGIEIRKLDSGPADEKTLEGLASLHVKEEVPFLIGPPTLEGSQRVILGVTGEHTILFITHPAVRLVAGELCLPVAFRSCMNSSQAGLPLAGWALTNLGRRVFITGDETLEANEVADGFAYGFERAGGTFTDRVMVNGESGDLKTVFAAIANSGADFVFAGFRGAAAVRFVKEFSQAGSDTKRPLLGPESLTAFPSTLAAEEKSSTGVRTLSCLVDPQGFVQRITAKTGKKVGDAVKAAEGFDLAKIIGAALEQTKGETKDIARIAGFIEQFQWDGPRGKVQFDKNHEPIVPVRVQSWESGGKTPKRKVIAELGQARSLDFGCGKVGYPKRPEPEQKEEEALFNDFGE
jgi:branched-chain amino acid transport system substrate-binding protein